MAVSQILADLDTSVNNATTVMGSAATLINGIGARVQAAVDKALANGATAEQLAPVQDEVNALNASADGLSKAVANVPPVDPEQPTDETSRRR